MTSFFVPSAARRRAWPARAVLTGVYITAAVVGLACGTSLAARLGACVLAVVSVLRLAGLHGIPGRLRPATGRRPGAGDGGRRA